MIPYKTRDAVLYKAIEECMKDIYSIVQPSVEWEDFKKQCEEYSIKYKEWENWRTNKTGHPEWEDKSIDECIGPKPFEFYYIPREIMKEIYNSYVNAYKIDNHKELLDTIEILKHYCKEPIVDKYIEGYTDEHGNHHPGYKGYEHPDNLEKELEKILHNTSTARLIQEKFFEFLDMAGNFYNWNRDLNSFGISVYLGPSPNTNKQAVIDNWKKYRNKEIEINDDVFNEEQDYD